MTTEFKSEWAKLVMDGSIRDESIQSENHKVREAWIESRGLGDITSSGGIV